MDLKSMAGDLTWMVFFGAMKLSKKRFCRVNSSLCVKFFSPLSLRVISVFEDSSLDARRGARRGVKREACSYCWLATAQIKNARALMRRLVSFILTVIDGRDVCFVSCEA